MTEIMQMIEAIGFPIAMCLICCWYVYKKDITHKEEMDKLTNAINEQTINIQKLITKLEYAIGGKEHGEET